MFLILCLILIRTFDKFNNQNNVCKYFQLKALIIFESMNVQKVLYTRLKKTIKEKYKVLSLPKSYADSFTGPYTLVFASSQDGLHLEFLRTTFLEKQASLRMKRLQLKGQ